MHLLVGGDSEIGAATAALMRGRGLRVTTTTRRPEAAADERVFFDFAEAASFEPPAETKAACIFVAVARLAACAEDPSGSHLVNVTQTVALVERLVSRGIFTVFLSTNQVFDGSVPQVLADAPHAPISAYGRQKAETERALMSLMAVGAPIAILRLAKVVSPGMKLLSDWNRELRAGRPVRAFADMTMAPTPSALVTEAIAALLAWRQPVIAQLTGPRDITYAEAARFIAAEADAPLALVETGSARDAGLPGGATPANTTLDSTWLALHHGLVVPDALDVVRQALGT